MSERKITLPEWRLFLNEKFQGVSRETLRSISLEALPRLMHVLDKNRHLCNECAVQYDILLSMILQIPSLFNNHDLTEQFKKELNKTTRILTLKHGLYPKGLWLSRITGIGIISGVAAAFIFYSLANKIDLPWILFLGAATGMVMGWIIGKYKEYQLKKDDKLY